MATEWKEVCIADLGEVVGGATPSTKNASFYGGDIAWITPKDLSNFNERYISRGERNITELGKQSCSTKLLPKNSVLFTSRAPIGYVAIAENELCTNQGFKSIIPNENTDYLFLFYLLKYNKNKIEAMGSGTTFKEVSARVMQSIKLRVPDKETQQKIAKILSALDEKIELNNKINENLHAQAQAIFKSWFVDFEPFGGTMPSDWEKGKLSDIVKVCYGKDHKKLENGVIPAYGSGGIIRYVEQFLYDKESVLIPRKGTLNNVFYMNELFWTVDTMFYTEMKREYLAKFIFYFVKGLNLEFMNVGSAVPSMTTAILNSLELFIPTEQILKNFDTVIVPLFNLIKNNDEENKKLAQIRDTLLPKLMSGELEV